MCSQKTSFLSAEVNNLKKRIYISLSRIIYFRGWLFYLHMDKMIYKFISELANDLVPFDDSINCIDKCLILITVLWRAD